MPHPHADKVSNAVDDLRAALLSSDDLPEATRETWWEVIALLNRAEDSFAGVGGGGEPDKTEGLRLVREALALLETTSGAVKRAADGVRRGFAEAQRTLDAVAGRPG